MTDIDRITGEVLDLSIHLHRELGRACLRVFTRRSWPRSWREPVIMERQRPVDIEFDGLTFQSAFRVDILIDHRLLIEVKSVDQLHPAHAKQLLTYLRLMKQPVGLLINFGGATLMEGFRRLVNDYRASDPAEATLIVGEN